MKKLKKMSISNSAIETFRQCPYRFYKRHVIGRILPEDNLAATFGTAIHQFIEDITIDPFQDIEKLMRKLHNQFKLPAYEFGSYSQFATICRNYIKNNIDGSGEDAMYPAMKDKNDKFLLEAKLEYCIDEESQIYINGTIDRIAETETGQIVLFDTKTTSGMSYWTKNGNRKAHLSQQLTQYSFLMAQHGLKPDYCVIDLVGTNPRFPGFQRLRTERSPERIAQWLVETKFYCNLIKQCIENDTFVRNMGEACQAFKGCAFLKHCMFPTEKEDKSLYKDNPYKGLILEWEE